MAKTFFDARLLTLVDLDVAALVGLDTDAIQINVDHVRPTRDADQHVVGIDGLLVLAVLVGDGYAQVRGALVDLRDGGPGQDLDAALLERARKGAAHVLVLERQERRQELDERHFGAEGSEHRRPLGTDRSAADDDDAFRDLLQHEGAVGVDDTGQVGARDRQRGGLGACGDDDLLAFDLRRRLSFGVGGRVVQRAAFAERRGADADNIHPGWRGEARVAVEDRHAIGLEELTNAVGERLDHGVLALQDRRVVEADVVGQHAKLGPVLGGLEQLGAAQHGLGGDAAPVQTHPTRPLLLNQRHAQPVLSRPDRGRVPARAAADDQHVKGARFFSHIGSF